MRGFSPKTGLAYIPTIERGMIFSSDSSFSFARHHIYQGIQDGGSEAVTKFGMYDRTEDFVGGGTNPPMIHSPGEYEALKA